MKRLAIAALLASLAAPALAFTGDLALPTLTWPSTDTATQACTSPVQIGTPTSCPRQ